jgi:hypothetical protein
MYTSRGPNFTIFVDGYDKLVPFGIAIHGAVDGFSRRILWLKAGPSNKNPRIIAGIENVIMKDIQITLRSFNSDSMKGLNSVSIGRSTANQRIEML